MAKRTQTERIIAGILANGGKEVTAKATRKSRVFIYPNLDSFLYVGNAGSLRNGKSKVASIPFDRLKAKFLTEQT